MTVMVEESPKGTVEIFCAYSRKDASLLGQFKAHTATMRREDNVLLWTDQDIPAGSDWNRELDCHLNSADIIVLLVSADFINSDYCYTKELKRAMERSAAGEVKVVPVIVRPCLWAEAPFRGLQHVPRDGKAVTQCPSANYDQAWVEVAKEIRNAVQAALEAKTRGIATAAGFTLTDLSRVQQMQRPNFDPAQIASQMQAWQRIQALQTALFKIQADVMAERGTEVKRDKRWDKYIRDA